MVFVGDGSAKEGEDAVAGGLHDEALIAMDRVHHQLQGRIDEAPGRFGIEAFNQGGGVFDVSKEGGNGLALTLGRTPCLQGGLLGEDTLG